MKDNEDYGRDHGDEHVELPLINKEMDKISLTKQDLYNLTCPDLQLGNSTIEDIFADN